MRKAVGAAVAITTAGTLPVFMVSTQAVLIRDDLHLSAARLGVALTTFFLASAAASPVAGFVADRTGARGSNVTAGVVATLSLTLIAANLGSYPLLLAAMVLGGAANALAQVSSNLLLAGAVTPDRLGLAFGIKQSAVPLATFFGGMAVPIFGATLGWRWGVVAAVVLCAVISAFAPLAAAAASGQRARPRRRERLITWPLVMIGVSTALASSAMNAHASFLVLWATDQEMSPTAAGVVLAVASLVSIAARIGSGLAADRRGGRNLVVVATQVALGAVGLTLVATGHPVAMVVGAIVAFGIGWSWPGLLMLAVVRAFPSREAGATGVIQTGAFVGGASGPFLFGLTAEAASYRTAWACAIAALLVASVGFALGRRYLVRVVDSREARDGLDGLDGRDSDVTAR